MVSDAGATEVVVLSSDGRAAMRSVVALDGERVVVGEAAEQRILSAPTSGAREPKRRLGDETPFVLASTPYSAEALMGHLLAHVVGVATESRGAPPDEVVLTHPATWSAYKLDLLREVARSAGLDEVTIVAEPVAAAAYYAGLGKVPVDATIAVYDFGGGTFDVAVVRGGPDGFGLLGTPEGLERLGGVDLDQAVVAHVDRALDGALGSLDRSDPAVLQGLARLRDECVRAKEALSSDAEVSIPVALPGLSTEVRLTRAELEAAIRPRISETLAALDRVVGAAGITVDDLDAIVLVGGSSRVPLVAELLAQAGRPIATDVDPKLAVAGGAVAPSVMAPTAGRVDDDPTPSLTSEGTDSGGGAAGAVGSTLTEKKPAEDRSATGRARVVKTAVGIGVAAGVAAGGSGVAFAVTQDDDDGPDDSDPFTSPADDDDDGNLDAFDEPDRAADGPTADASDGPRGPAGHAGAGGRAGGSGDSSGGDGGGSRSSSGAAGRRGSSERSRDESGEEPTHGASGSAPPSEPAAPPASDMSNAGDAGAPAGASPSMPGPIGNAAGAPEPHDDDRLEAFKDQLRDRLEKWAPPKTADAKEVAELRDELEGRIERFQPAPGQSFEQAAGDIQQGLEDTIEDFAQDEQIEQLQEQVRGQAMEDRDDLQDQREFAEFQQALVKYAKDWQPAWEPWIADNVEQPTLRNIKDQAIADATTRASFSPDKDLRGQQLALEASVKHQLEAWQQKQYDIQYEQQRDTIAQERDELLATATDANRGDVESQLQQLKARQDLLNDVYRGLKTNPPNKGNDAADAELQKEIEPADDVRSALFTDAVATDGSSTISALLADQADDGAAGFEASDMVNDSVLTSAALNDDLRVAAQPIVQTTMSSAAPTPPDGLVDMFDEMAATPTTGSLADAMTTSAVSSPPPGFANPDMAGGVDQTPPGARTFVQPEASAPLTDVVSPPPPLPVEAASALLEDPVFGAGPDTPGAVDADALTPAAPAAPGLLDDDVLGAEAAQVPVAPAPPTGPEAAPTIPGVSAVDPLADDLTPPVPGVPAPGQPADDPFAPIVGAPEVEPAPAFVDADGDGVPDAPDPLDDTVP